MAVIEVLNHLKLFISLDSDHVQKSDCADVLFGFVFFSEQLLYI